jgi:hypothetical protein
MIVNLPVDLQVYLVRDCCSELYQVLSNKIWIYSILKTRFNDCKSASLWFTFYKAALSFLGSAAAGPP